MHGIKENSLIVVESGQLVSFCLDDRLSWEVGRISGANVPDIGLHTPTVSRKHGQFRNIDGTWFYMDHKGKNGTVYNGKKILPGIGGRVKPIPLENGDILIFGGANEAVVNAGIVWTVFLTTTPNGPWRVEDTRGMEAPVIGDETERRELNSAPKGTVVQTERGMAVYMGDVTFLNGDISVWT